MIWWWLLLLLLQLEPCLQVPPQYKHFANAIQQCPEHWEDEEAIRAELEREATGNDKVETFLAMVRG